MAMMRPPFCFSIGRIAACVSVNVAVRFVAITASQSSRFIRISNWSRVMPALLTTMSSRPCFSTISPGAFASARVVGDVERDGFGAAARRADLVGGRLRVVAARGADDERALRGKLRRDGFADPARCAGHERDFAGRDRTSVASADNSCLHVREIVGAAEIHHRGVAMNFFHESAQDRAGTHLNIRCDAF